MYYSGPSDGPLGGSPGPPPTGWIIGVLIWSGCVLDHIEGSFYAATRILQTSSRNHVIPAPGQAADASPNAANSQTNVRLGSMPSSEQPCEGTAHEGGSVRGDRFAVSDQHSFDRPGENALK